jgi:hypothetical protein
MVKLIKMKLIVFVIAMTGSFYMAAGQTYYPFVDTGKVWSTYHNYCKENGNVFSEFIKFDKDTLIDGKLYKIAWSSLDTNMASWTISSFIREDAQKKVFHRYPYAEWEFNIYDFGAMAGDTIGLRQNEYDTSFYAVDSVNWATLLDGSQRRIFYLTCLFFQPCNEIWIEGMGCTKGVFQGGTCGFVGDNPSLICFTENDTLKYFNPDFDQCYVITGIDDPGSQKTKISIFPNPVKETLTIKVNQAGNINMKFELIDLAGKEVFSIPVLQTETFINLKKYDVAPGFYIYQVSVGETLITTGTLMILE